MNIELVCPVCKSKNIKVDYNVSRPPFTQIDVLEGFIFKCHDCSVLFHDNSIEATCGSNICVCCIMHENKPRMMDILSPQQRRALANRLLEIDKEKGYGMMTDLSFDEFLNKRNELVRVTTKI